MGPLVWDIPKKNSGLLIWDGQSIFYGEMVYIDHVPEREMGGNGTLSLKQPKKESWTLNLR